MSAQHPETSSHGQSNGANPTAQQQLPPAALALAERLFDAARNGQSDLLIAALNHNPGIKNLTNAKGDTLLMLASYHGHVELTRTLLQQYGADPNVLNARGQSPLAGSVFKNEPDILSILLENGANPDLGTPSAEECLKVFSLQDKYGPAFEEARKQIKGESNSADAFDESP